MLNFPIHAFVEFFTRANAALKIIIFFVAWIVFWLPMAIPIAKKLQWHPPQPLTEAQKLPLLISLYLLSPLMIWGVTWIEGTSFARYGLEFNLPFWIATILGLGFSLVGLVVIFSIESSLGWVCWQGENFKTFRSLLLPILILALGIGLVEELIFRGFLFDTLAKDYSWGIAAIVSSIIFALLHFVWAQKETLPQLPGLILMGLVLLLARWVDGGRLGLAWGLHAGWIWGLICLDSSGLMVYTERGEPWLIGWGGKPLAGLMGILCLGGTGFILGLLAKGI
ncbi:CPBP family intramembrane metalloprotease [Lusitaniella coriacea LEGE 07157]|uniref:CPBP family intramembrane metalloprotease n=1 Tax=Lusitaniella coriacea LEGE 07157 TaxID=945747 RepID=A0A8J7E0A2_9CYAN|nr:CPBP family intramembrane glutamic endopeptidase [Lusitaniella coriacea]MBE9118927.1 CPBP family intramembrane metalloprotease [Lusitaniella coriacea LEGE 07157]